MEKKLELLALGEDFIIEKKENRYSIRQKEGNLEASIDFLNAIGYYISGCYNSKYDTVEINMDALNKLKRFCEILIDGGK